MTSPARFAVGAVVAAGVVLVAGLSLVGDLVSADFPLSLVLFVLDARVLLGLAVAILWLSFVLYLYSLRSEDPSRLRHGGRAVDALVPAYGDAAVLHRSVEALVAAEYEDLTVTVVTEPDDEASRERATELAEEHADVRHLVNDDHPGSKAGALNAAIAASEADVIGMFDADQEPHPRLVPHAVAALEESAIARVRSLPDPSGGVLESLAYYEYLLLYFLPQKLVRSLLGLAFAGTRSVLVERSVFEEVGTFPEGHLAEDLEFTHRCHQAGVPIRELLYYPTFEEPAHALRDWWGQRVRWMSGQIAVGHGHARRWRNLLDPDYLGSLLTLVGTLVAGVLLATTVPKLALAATRHPLAVGAGLGGVYAVALATRIVDDRTADLDGVDLAWLFLPVALTVFGLVIVRVIVTYAVGREAEWYSVEKTAES